MKEVEWTKVMGMVTKMINLARVLTVLVTWYMAAADHFSGSVRYSSCSQFRNWEVEVRPEAKLKQSRIESSRELQCCLLVTCSRSHFKTAGQLVIIILTRINRF